jgi:starch synthase
VPRLEVLFVVSECVPLVKTGGLGDVAGALPVELKRRGHDVRVVMPRYRAAKSYPAYKLDAPLSVTTGLGERWAAVWQGSLPGDVPIYLIEHDVLFDRDGVYGDSHGEFGDNAFRYSFLSQAGIALCSYLGFEPDLMHVHDWQTALVPAMLSQQSQLSAATVLSIHNMGYQGSFGADQGLATGLTDVQLAAAEHNGTLNLLKAGLLEATRLSTVSPRYAYEIQTAAGGAGLDEVMRQRSDALVGILNGIDEDAWDPATDTHLVAHYTASDLSGKAICKRELQRELGLPIRADVPLVGLVSRFAEQKGIDIFAAALEHLLPLDIQFAVLGSGLSWAETLFDELSESTPRFRARIGFDEGLAHRIEAAADMFVMPSRYEPCGLNQMYSQRYGTLPIVRAVGGLRDTVEHDITGFVFEALDGVTLAATIAHAADSYRARSGHFQQMQQAAMAKRMGWDRTASQYEALYRLAISEQRASLEG